MKKYLTVGFVSALIVCALGFAVAANAAEKPKDSKAKTEAPAKETSTLVKGTVAVVKDDKGAIKDCTIKADDGTVYTVGPAAEAKKIEQLDGKAVEATGVVSEKDGAKHLKVKAFKAVEAAPAAAK